MCSWKIGSFNIQKGIHSIPLCHTNFSLQVNPQLWFGFFRQWFQVTRVWTLVTLVCDCCSPPSSEAQLGQTTKIRQKLDYFFFEIEQSYLSLQQFDNLLTRHTNWIMHEKCIHSMVNGFDIKMTVQFIFQILGPFRIDQLELLVQPIWPYMIEIRLNWLCWVASRSKMAPIILINFSSLIPFILDKNYWDPGACILQAK